MEAINSKRQGKVWSRGTNSRLPFGVNATLDLSITMHKNSENKPLQIYPPPPQTRNAKNPPLNNPSEYKPH